MASSFISQHDSLLLLEKYLPTIYSLICSKRNKCKNIINKYNDKYDQMASDIKEHGAHVSKMATIFDHLWDASEGHPQKKSLCLFIDNIVSQILAHVDGSHKDKISNICYRMITDFNTSQSEYFNCLSELCVLAGYVTSDHFTLEHIEAKLKNGKGIDFKFRCNNTFDFYVEVQSIHFDVRKIESGESLRQFLTYRIEEKFMDKELHDSRETLPVYRLESVLWGVTKPLAKYLNVFNAFNAFETSSRLNMISEYVSLEDEYVYKFEPVTTFLETIEAIEERNNTL